MPSKSEKKSEKKTPKENSKKTDSKSKTNSKEKKNDDNNDKNQILTLQEMINKKAYEEGEFNIKNNDELREHFHGIHNLIRNQFAQYGKNALAIFNFVYGLKFIEPMIRNKKIPLSDNCLFSEIVKLRNNAIVNRVHEVQKEIYYDEKADKVKESFFSALPYDKINVKGDVLGELFRRVDAIDYNKFDIAGKNYEYFLGFTSKKNKGGKSGSQIDDLGQYFTDRCIIKYLIAKVNPKLNNDGSIPSMTDTFCGSCGFPTEYIRYMNHNNKNIDWEENIKNIYACDADEAICKTARMDIMSLTNVLPYDNEERRVIVEYKNSFTEDFDRKFDFYFTNPPYGGDKGKNAKDKVQLLCAGKQIKHVAETGNVRIPLKESNKPRIVKYKITGDNKETLSLLLGMGILNKNGIYAGVLKEGLFFDKKYLQLRKELINNYKVEYVISVPQDMFENTTVKTSILIFKNEKPNKENYKVKFCELKTRKDKDGHQIGIDEFNMQDKSIINEFTLENYKFESKEGKYIEASYNEIVEKNYSLNYKSYIVDNIVANKGFKVVKLCDICTINPRSDVPECKEYRYIEIGDMSDNKLLVKQPINSENLPSGTKRRPDVGDILIASVRPNSSKIVYFTDNYNFDNLVTSGAIFNLRFNDKNIGVYTYYYFLFNLDEKLKLMGNGSSYPRISPEILGGFELPIPEDDDTAKNYINLLTPCINNLIALHNLQELQLYREKSICKLIFEKCKMKSIEKDIIKKSSLNKEFEFMDKLRNDIQNTLKNQEVITKKMMEMVLGNTNKTDENTDNESQNTNDEDEVKEKPKKKKVEKIKKDNTDDDDSNNEKDEEKEIVVKKKKVIKVPKQEKSDSSSKTKKK